MSHSLDDDDRRDTPLPRHENPFRADPARRATVAPILATGTIYSEPAGGKNEARRTVGGTASHFGLSARFLAPVELIGTVEADFGLDDFAVLAQHGLSTSGIRRRAAVTTPTQAPDDLDAPPGVTDEYALDGRGSKRPSAIYLSGISPAAQLDLLQHNPHTDILALDLGQEWYGARRSDVMSAIRSAAIVFVNGWHARLLTGVSQFVGAARYLQELGAGIVVLRHAEYGASAFIGSQVIKLPAFPLIDCVDPTGAGASFAGGFLSAVAWTDSIDSTSLMTAMLCGTVLASFTVEGVGVARNLTLSREDLADRFDQLLSMVQQP